jgi:hypothetical protein
MPMTPEGAAGKFNGIDTPTPGTFSHVADRRQQPATQRQQQGPGVLSALRRIETCHVGDHHLVALNDRRVEKVVHAGTVGLDPPQSVGDLRNRLGKVPENDLRLGSQLPRLFLVFGMNDFVIAETCCQAAEFADLFRGEWKLDENSHGVSCKVRPDPEADPRQQCRLAAHGWQLVMVRCR